MARHLSAVCAVVALSVSLCGCATVNFSANYYTPPVEYRQELQSFFSVFTASLALQKTYALRIVGDKESGTRGIPAIKGETIAFPDNFLKYIYQNYYCDRFKVFACISAHEICHSEYPHPSGSPQQHFLTDERAVALAASHSTLTPTDFYKSYRVVQNYWSARKGVAGHACNIGWNLLNAVSLVYAGVGSFGDWFATDMSPRMKMLVKKYRITDRRCFTRWRQGGSDCASTEWGFSLK